MLIYSIVKWKGRLGDTKLRMLIYSVVKWKGRLGDTKLRMLIYSEVKGKGRLGNKIRTVDLFRSKMERETGTYKTKNVD